jgi:hypothetical protein
MPPAFPEVVAADAGSLLGLVSSRIDEDMLREIAAADYGRDVEMHLAPLRLLRDAGAVPVPLGWEPRETLELIRWSQPDDPQWVPGGQGHRGHWMRAFACTALLRAELDPGNICGRADGQNQTLAPLLTSLRALPDGLEPAAAAFLVWAIRRMESDERERGVSSSSDLAFFGAGLVWLLARHDAMLAPAAAVIELCRWIAAREAIANEEAHPGFGVCRGAWLLSTTGFNLSHADWRSIAADLAAAPMNSYPAEARDWVRLLAAMITDG